MHVQPRESMRCLPGFIQPFLTWVTGVPLENEKPIIHWTSSLAALLAVTFIVIGIIIGCLAINSAILYMIPLLIISWAFITSGMRRLDVVIIHQSLHNMVAKTRKGNRIIGEIITMLLWRVPFDENRKEHMIHHQFPCTERDVDVQYLRATGFRPDMTANEFKSYLLRNLISPKHHAKFFWSRIRSNLFSAKPFYRLVMSWIYLAALVIVFTITNIWFYWLILWLIPVSILFQNSTFLYTHTEHRWWLYGNKETTDKQSRDKLSFGRLCGESVPDKENHTKFGLIKAWSIWWLRMMAIHAPYRFCVLVGDTVQHDTHHIVPGCDWANSAFVRRDSILAGSKRYDDVWGSLLDHLYESAGINKKKI